MVTISTCQQGYCPDLTLIYQNLVWYYYYCCGILCNLAAHLYDNSCDFTVTKPENDFILSLRYF